MGPNRRSGKSHGRCWESWVAFSKIPSDGRMGRKLVPIEGSAYYYLENLKGLVLDVQYANADAQARVWL